MGSTAMMFKALADENRLLLLRLLRAATVACAHWQDSWIFRKRRFPQHLKVLREAGLIFAEKCGYFMHYTVNRAAA